MARLQETMRGKKIKSEKNNNKKARRQLDTCGTHSSSWGNRRGCISAQSPPGGTSGAALLAAATPRCRWRSREIVESSSSYNTTSASISTRCGTAGSGPSANPAWRSWRVMQVGRRQITVWTEQRHGCGAGALESLQVCHRHAPGGGDPAVRKGCPNTPEFGMKKLTKMCTKSSQS